jgi:hypothetical protein
MSANPQAPPDGNVIRSIPGAVGISILFVLTTFLYALRIYTRVRPNFQLSAADYAISVAFVSTYGTYLGGEMLMFPIDMRTDRIY